MEAAEGAVLALIAVLIFAWSLVARRAERWGITSPMVFIVVGATLVASLGDTLTTETVRFLAELTLVLVLFHDASTVRLAQLRRDPWIPARLLLIGFPLALIATTVSTLWLFPAASIAFAVLIAGSITPTDAGLGAPTILNPKVPLRVRRALNEESGLNDGLATPVVLAALTFLVSEEGGAPNDGLTSVLDFAAVPVATGIVIGLVLGLGGAWLMDVSRDHGWSTLRGRGLVVFAVPLLCFGLALLTDANAFIAAFIGGLAFGRRSRCIDDEPTVSLTLETFSDLFAGVLWFVAGGLLVESITSGFKWQWLAMALLALTVLRTVPVVVSMAGMRLHWQTLTYIGWFGPRGIATIVFGLLAVEELGFGDARLADIAGITTLTVLISVFAHGLSAGPLSKRYGAWVSRNHPPIEMEPSIEPIPSRGRQAVQDQM